MRPDMGKVVIERPRLNHGMMRGTHNTSTATRGRVAVESIEPPVYDEYGTDIMRTDTITGQTRVREHREKEFSDLIGPLRGYLRKQVGRPWNAVNSELARTIDRRSLQGRHIWTHVLQEVDTTVTIYRDVAEDAR